MTLASNFLKVLVDNMEILTEYVALKPSSREAESIGDGLYSARFIIPLDDLMIEKSNLVGNLELTASVKGDPQRVFSFYFFP